jgi:hypothetical protein
MTPATITISSSPRGLPGGNQTAATFTPAQCVATWSWGLQPGTALIDWVSAQAQPALVSGASLTISLAGHTFWGFCDNVVLRVGTDGYTLMQEFKDNRRIHRQILNCAIDKYLRYVHCSYDNGCANSNHRE